MSRHTSTRTQEGRYPALVAILNRRREVFGLCDRELAERTASRFGASKNVSQIHRILHGDSGTRQRYAEQLASVVDVGRHVARLLIEFEDELLPLPVPAEPTRALAAEVQAAYERDEDTYALQGAVGLYEATMGRVDLVSIRVRADMSLLIGKLVRSHGRYPGFIDDALRFVDDAVDLYMELGELDGAEHAASGIDAAQVAAEIERATIYRRRGHLDMALRTLEFARANFAAVLAASPSLDGKCWHGFGDLYEQKAVIRGHSARGAAYSGKARQSYDAALLAYAAVDGDRNRVDRHAILTDLAMIDVRAGAYEDAIARLDALEAEGNLSPTVQARLANRRAWAALGQGDELGCQRFARLASSTAQASGDALLMAMAEALRETVYVQLGMEQKAEVQHEAVLEWIFRDGVRHAEVLGTIVERARQHTDEDGTAPAWTQRLGWLLRGSWLQALLVAVGMAAMGGCAVDGLDGGELELRTVAGATIAISDPKLSDPKLSDPKLEAARDRLAQLGASDPKSDPKLSDPKLSDPKLSDPKRTSTAAAATASDPKKTSSDPKTTSSDPKHPTSSCPTASDPKHTASDPKLEAASDPKKTASDPKKTASDPKKTASDPKKTADEEFEAMDDCA
ncbi:MAG: hypothetical protein H6747_08170 [Deltaproteobacteria bacterium]|nr:hypothetical protein [Deltaproteobacteria bacterium]